MYCYSHVGGEDAVDEVLLRQVEGALQLVVVEGDLSGAGAVEPRLHERGPRVLQEEAPADVVLADSRYAGIDRLATVVLHCVLPQEEEGEQADVIRRDKVWLCRGGGEEAEKKGGGGGGGSLRDDSRERRNICNIYLRDAVALTPVLLIIDCNKNFKIILLLSCL